IMARALAEAGVNVVSYALQDKRADFYCGDINYRGDGIEFELYTPAGRARLHTALLGQFNLSNLLGVSAAAMAAGLSWQQLQDYLPKLAPVKGRMQLFNRAGVTAIIDYAHTPDALAKALAAVRQHCRGQLACVFGCGGDRDKGKRPQMGEIVAAEADRVIVTSDNPRSEDPAAIIEDILPGIEAPAGRQLAITVEVDRRLAIEQAIASAADGDCILIAGKGHENYQEIDGQRLHFDDYEVASAALARRAQLGVSV
ncbi:MAG: UDP-N-acetylmuramyl-tripeptide synthetase, partial [Cellvibrionaceae bacterium]|nr:UDP-N-acetylmuramyl-tripeptide synthetase [Cellvibrionaceae bacterium]